MFLAISVFVASVYMCACLCIPGEEDRWSLLDVLASDTAPCGESLSFGTGFVMLKPESGRLSADNAQAAAAAAGPLPAQSRRFWVAQRE
jgi:hypothetical protein